MNRFIETELGKQMFEELVRQSKEYDDTLTEEERLVKEQKTLLYKFYCKAKYGHLFRAGKCLRCGQLAKK